MAFVRVVVIVLDLYSYNSFGQVKNFLMLCFFFLLSMCICLLCVCVFLSVVMQDRGNESSDIPSRRFLNRLSVLHMFVCLCVSAL